MTAVFAVCIALTVSWFYGPFIHSTHTTTLYDYNSMEQKIVGTIGSGEYLLSGCDIFGINEMKPQKDTAQLTSSRDPQQKTGNVWNCRNVGEEAQLLLPVFGYDHFHIFDRATGEEMQFITDKDTQRISVTIPAGYDGSFELRYIAPAYWHICEAVSVLTLLLVIALALAGRKKKKAAVKAAQ